MKKKPKANLWHIILKTISVYKNKTCPRCLGIEPYYRDCPICEGYVIGCDKALELETMIKYLSWLKDDNF